jgi:hypothetical protein
MAIVVIEEALAGLDEVKASLDQAVMTLTELIDALSPTMVPQLQNVLKRSLLRPLTTHVAALAQLLETLASMAESVGEEDEQC